MNEWTQTGARQHTHGHACTNKHTELSHTCSNKVAVYMCIHTCTHTYVFIQTCTHTYVYLQIAKRWEWISYNLLSRAATRALYVFIRANTRTHTHAHAHAHTYTLPRGETEFLEQSGHPYFAVGQARYLCVSVFQVCPRLVSISLQICTHVRIYC